MILTSTDVNIQLRFARTYWNALC